MHGILYSFFRFSPEDQSVPSVKRILLLSSGQNLGQHGVLTCQSSAACLREGSSPRDHPGPVRVDTKQGQRQSSYRRKFVVDITAHNCPN